jgi:hypothetical protein
LDLRQDLWSDHVLRHDHALVLLLFLLVILVLVLTVLKLVAVNLAVIEPAPDHGPAHRACACAPTLHLRSASTGEQMPQHALISLS